MTWAALQRRRQAAAASRRFQPLAFGCAWAPGRSRLACSTRSAWGLSRGVSLKRLLDLGSLYMLCSGACGQLPLSLVWVGLLSWGAVGRSPCRLMKGQAWALRGGRFTRFAWSSAAAGRQVERLA